MFFLFEAQFQLGNQRITLGGNVIKTSVAKSTVADQMYCETVHRPARSTFHGPIPCFTNEGQRLSPQYEFSTSESSNFSARFPSAIYGLDDVSTVKSPSEIMQQNDAPEEGRGQGPNGDQGNPRSEQVLQNATPTFILDVFYFGKSR